MTWGRAALLAAFVVAATVDRTSTLDFELLGVAVVPREAPGVTPPIGGLSSITWDAATGSYYAISDDPGRLAPPRIYRLGIDLRDGALSDGDIDLLGQAELRMPGGRPIQLDLLDPEGLARGPRGSWWVASEGHADTGVPPALIEFSAEGIWIGEMLLPQLLAPRKRAGVRHNLALESAAITPDARWLYTATESALKQDGAPAGADAGSLNRLFRFDLRRLRHSATFVYPTEPLAAAPAEGVFAVNGLVDLLALGDERLLALERSFTVGAGHRIRLFLIDLIDATDVKGVKRLTRGVGEPVTKQLLLDVAELGIEPDNLEGVTFGPDLPDGRRTLVLVADDNFDAEQQNQVIALAMRSGLLDL